jgi:hypothetical protein
LKLAYVDSSCVVAICFGEPGYERVVNQLDRFDRLLASNLMEAELRAALVREGAGNREADLLAGFTWIYPNRPLTAEYRRILAAGPLRGADLWHLACALFLAPEARDLAFLTLDQQQQAVARELGFAAID